MQAMHKETPPLSTPTYQLPTLEERWERQADSPWVVMPATSPEAKAKESERKKRNRASNKLDPLFIEKERARQRLGYAVNGEKIKLRKRKWWKIHGHKRNAKRRSAPRIREKLKTAYGVTPEFREGLIVKQGNLCSICGDVLGIRPTDKHMDHDHSMPKGERSVRGILCRACNVGIGHLRDSRDILQSAIDYLDSHSAQQATY